MLFNHALPTSNLANLSLAQDGDHPGLPSPDSMMIDHPDEHLVDANGMETDNVAEINPDSDRSEPSLPVASDCG